MINLGIFYEHVKTQVEELIIKKSKEKDPIYQFALGEQISILHKMLNDYTRFMEDKL